MFSHTKPNGQIPNNQGTFQAPFLGRQKMRSPPAPMHHQMAFLMEQMQQMQNQQQWGNHGTWY